MHTPLDTLLAPHTALLTPLSPTPCGPNLEYDSHYLALFIKLIPKQKMSVGGEAGSEKLESELEPLRWTEIEQDCLALMHRTRDARLAATFTRCRVQHSQWQGLLEGLALTLALLRNFPETLHPALIPDDAENGENGESGERDVLPRADALSALADHEGLLNDIRSLPLEDGSRLRVHMRDVERALTRPHPDNVLPAEAARRMLTDMRQKGAPHCLALMDALELTRAIAKEATENMGEGMGEALRLQPLLDLLQTVAGAGAKPARLSERGELNEGGELGSAGTASSRGAGVLRGEEQMHQQEAANHAMQQSQAECFGQAESQGGPHNTASTQHCAPAVHAPILHRNEARERIREARQWFEEHEPSSPVALLLRKAEQLVGKRFAEVVETLPMELLEKWEQEQ